jgi:hypothetical protein
MSSRLTDALYRPTSFLLNLEGKVERVSKLWQTLHFFFFALMKDNPAIHFVTTYPANALMLDVPRTEQAM